MTVESANVPRHDITLGAQVGKGACWGDSGGPIYTDSGQVAGLTSRGSELLFCANTKGIYTALQPYHGWIDAHTK